VLLEHFVTQVLNQRALPQSTQRIAIKYLLCLWKGLTIAVHDLRALTHNNLT